MANNNNYADIPKVHGGIYFRLFKSDKPLVKKWMGVLSGSPPALARLKPPKLPRK